MELTAKRKNLLKLVKAANTVARATDERPIFRNLLLEADQDLYITVSDMVTGLRLRLANGELLSVKSGGRALLSALTFQRVVESIPDAELNITLRDNRLVVSGNKAKFELSTEDARDFPPIRKFDVNGRFVQLISTDFVNLLRRVVFFAHTDYSIHNMHGVLFKLKQDRLHIVGTNGQRLGVASAQIKATIGYGADGPSESSIVPAKALEIFSKLPIEAELIDIQCGNKSISVRSDAIELTITTISGQYVPYERGIPNNKKLLRIQRKRLVELLKQSLALKTSGDTFIDLSLATGSLTLKSTVKDVGAAEISDDAEWGHGKLSIYIDPQFLLDSAQSMSSDYVIFEFGGQMDQTLIREECDNGLQNMGIFSVVREP